VKSTIKAMMQADVACGTQCLTRINKQHWAALQLVMQEPAFTSNCITAAEEDDAEAVTQLCNP
jgi:hypothetical protein